MKSSGAQAGGTTIRHAERVYHTLRDESAGGRSALAASWTRSLQYYGLDPEHAAPPQYLDGMAYRDAREMSELMIRAAMPVLDRLAVGVRQGGYCVLLADAHGVALENRCEAGDASVFKTAGLMPGAIWDEAHEGTNGIGTCLAEDRVLTIHRDQHFYARNVAMSCTMAPIHDARGMVVGGIDISLCGEKFDLANIAFLPIVVEDAARRIEARLFGETFPDCRVVSVGQECQAMLALDEDEVVIGANRPARALFGLNDDRLTTLPDLLSESGYETPARAAHVALQRMLARCGGNISAAARELGISRATLHRKLRRNTSCRA